MPRHAFKFPPEVISAVKNHVRSAVDAVSPQRYRQEPNYTAALLGRMEGTAYEGEGGRVIFSNTVFDDRGRNSAESLFGADFAITATITDGRTTVKKAILVQAKLGAIEELSSRERQFLGEQIRKMKQLVAAPKVMEILERDGRRYPSVVSGNRVLDGHPYSSVPLEDYFVTRVTTTLDGATNPDVVEAVGDSSLSRLNVHAAIRV